MPKYLVGQYVIADCYYPMQKQGRLRGKIMKIDDRWFGVECEEFIDGHSLGGLGREGYCWWFLAQSLKSAEAVSTYGKED